MKAIYLLFLAAVLCSACTPANSHVEASATSARASQTQGVAMQLTINNHSFTADLTDTVAAQELCRLLPLTLIMQDHLGNEKHALLPQRLTTADQRPHRIEAGDVMLWQGQTIVVFYESFDSSYHYTRLGKIRETENLKSAVGQGAVQVHFTAVHGLSNQ